MSQRPKSTISSPLFMEDPVPVRNANLSTDNTEETYYVKGDDNDKDVVIVNNQGGLFQLNRNTLRETLNDLKSQHNVSIKQLDTDHTEAFRNVVEALKLLYGSQAIYDLVLSDIRSIFSNTNDIKPGTVAAFFVGCFSDDNFTGPSGCNPKCASSLQPSDGTPGYSSCEDLVLIYSDGSFSSLNDKQSSNAYIYIEDPNFVQFTQENIHQLKEAGVATASLIFGNQDGSYKEVTSSVAVDKLPFKVEKSDVTAKQGSGVIGFLVTIVVVILLIALIVFLIKTLF